MSDHPKNCVCQKCALRQHYEELAAMVARQNGQPQAINIADPLFGNYCPGGCGRITGHNVWCGTCAVPKSEPEPAAKPTGPDSPPAVAYKQALAEGAADPNARAKELLEEYYAAMRRRARRAEDSKPCVLYLAHPVSGDVAANVERAKRWLRWAQRAFPACAVIAPWIHAIEVVGDDDANPEHRERGLQRDEAVAARCDAVLWVGGRVSAGMAREGKVARAVVDLTVLGDEPPEAA